MRTGPTQALGRKRLQWIATFVLLRAATELFAQSVALVTDVVGKAAVEGEAGREAVAILSEISKDVRLQLEDGAQPTAVDLSSGDEYTFAVPSAAGAAGVRVGEVMSR